MVNPDTGSDYSMSLCYLVPYWWNLAQLFSLDDRPHNDLPYTLMPVLGSYPRLKCPNGGRIHYCATGYFVLTVFNFYSITLHSKHVEFVIKILFSSMIRHGARAKTLPRCLTAKWTKELPQARLTYTATTLPETKGINIHPARVILAFRKNHFGLESEKLIELSETYHWTPPSVPPIIATSETFQIC